MHTKTRILATGSVLTLFLAGCGGGGSSDGGSDQFLSDSSETDNVLVHLNPGVFDAIVGFADGSSTTGLAVVSATGRALVAFSFSDITVTRVQFKSDGTFSEPSTDVFFDNEWKTIDSVVKGQALTRRVVEGVSETTAGESLSSFKLERRDALSDAGASINLIDRTFFEQTTSTISTSLTIDSSGGITGSDTTGCIFEGTITVPDERFNVYEVSANVSNCGSAPDTPAELRNGSFSGLALYDQQAGELGSILTNGKVVASFFGT